MSDQAPVKFVVGIGASAGGLESLERFFRGMPEDSGLAFVVVQHLPPDHRSVMEQLITRFVRIRVTMAADGDPLEPNHIYLLPPGKEMEIRAGSIVIADRIPERVLAFPIDRMLTSLAEAYGPNAIAVILSGSGSDGSRGVRRIDALGGLVMVEDPLLASFDGMPRSAIDTGAPTAIMSAESLAYALIEHVQTGAPAQSHEMEVLEKIIRLLKQKTEADFEEYKRGTLYRRAIRRAGLRNCSQLAEYRELLERDDDELVALEADLLVGVTSFLRNPEWFELLAHAVDALATDKIEPNRELRAWCAGCASGEEAYSIAILLDEAIRRAGSSRAFKVFATDINPRALEHASAGVFSADRLTTVSNERLERYFVRRSNGDFQVNAALRHHLVFSRHDLTRDTPFINLDIAVCRNLLIYLKLPAQRRALASLSYGLRVGGIMFLGSSESLGELTPHFDVLNESAKLFKKRVHSRGMSARTEIPTRVRQGGLPAEPGRGEGRLLPTYDAVLEAFMPPGFLISEQRALLDSYGKAAKLLKIPDRRPAGDFFELLPSSARMVVTGLFVRAQREPGLASALVPWETEEENQSFVVTARRLEVRNGEAVYVLSLGDAPSHSVPVSLVAEPASTVHLQEELTHARITLQATVEELESSNEELQATNEELTASNEELQSVNEELHSVNEELHTVNAEHQAKIGELLELNRDISHLLASIDVATVYLDSELNIRKYTPRAGELFRFVEHDIGRQLESFNHPLYYPAFMEDVRSVRDGGPRVETEVRGRDERWYFVRILPYKIGSNVQGVVVSLTDATALAVAKDRARQLSSIVESSADAVISMDLEGRITSWNAAAERLYGYPSDEAVGSSIMMLVPEGERSAMVRLLEQIGAGAEHVNVATSRVAKSGELLTVAKTMSPVRDAHGIAIGISTFDRDIHEQKDLERRLRESERRYEDLYHHAPDMYLAVNTRSGRIEDCNATFLRLTGYSNEQVLNLHLLDLFPTNVQDVGRDALNQLRLGEPINDRDLKIRFVDGTELDTTLSASAVFHTDGSVVGARVTLRDVSVRKQAEAQFEEASALRERFLAMVSHELRAPLHAISAAFQVIDKPNASVDAIERSQRVLRRQTRQMIRLVDDLLDVSRITHGKLHLEHRPLALVQILRSALDAAAPGFHEKGVQLLSEGLESDLPMFGDAGRLEQVITNLLVNALRHTPAGRVVRVSCGRRGATSELVVADEGSGIEPKDLATIFDMFSQARQGRERSAGGLGLGLTIAQHIVNAHGGSISVQSGGVGRGATFTVRLPLDVRAKDAEGARSQPGTQLSIVLVEDQEDNREMMRALLELEGHKVFVAADGEQGLERILAARPDLAILDIGLPKMTGHELAKAVRAELGDGIRLLAMSGYGQPQDLRESEASGFDLHLTKPLDHTRLKAALFDLTAVSRQRDDSPESSRPALTLRRD